MKCWLFSQAICSVNLKSNGSNLFKVLMFQDAMNCSVVNTNTGSLFYSFDYGKSTEMSACAV